MDCTLHDGKDLPDDFPHDGTRGNDFMKTLLAYEAQATSASHASHSIGLSIGL